MQTSLNVQLIYFALQAFIEQEKKKLVNNKFLIEFISEKTEENLL